MGAKIITGYTGERHITPLDDAAIYRSIFGRDSYITNEANLCRGSMPSVNEFTVESGQLSIQGVQVRISAETLAVDACATGKKRIDLIVARWTHDSTSGIDDVELAVLKGAEVDASNTPVPPAYNEGDINAGATAVDMPLYRLDMAGASVSFSLVASKVEGSLFEAMIPDGAAAHNAYYRGKKLGDSVTAEQWEEIKSGRFRGMFVGDYWEMRGITWRIADFDYWLKSGSTGTSEQLNGVTLHHVVIIPDESLGSGKMNSTNVVTGAYGESYMRSNGMITVRSLIESTFDTHVLERSDYIKNAVSGGYETSGEWAPSRIDLMTEAMVYGGKIYGNAQQGVNAGDNHAVSNSQLALFRHDHSSIILGAEGDRKNYWLRDVANSTSFACVSRYGYSAYLAAGSTAEIRPAFAVCVRN